MLHNKKISYLIFPWRINEYETQFPQVNDRMVLVISFGGLLLFFASLHIKNINCPLA